MDPHKLAAKHTVPELVNLMDADALDPANIAPAGSINKFNERGRMRQHIYTWAITYRQCADKGVPFPAATFKNYKTRKYNR